MRRWTLIPVMLVLILSLVVSGCQSTPQTTKLIVGTSADYPPFESMEGTNFVGYDMDLMREVGKKMGMEVEFQNISFDGLIPALQSGKINAIISAMSANDERRKQVDFTEPYFIGSDAVLVAEESTITVASNDDLAPLRIGVQSGTTQEAWLTENFPDAQISRYEKADQGVLDLKSGRIDVLAMDYYAAISYINAGGIKLALKTEFAGESYSIAVAKGNTELVNKFNEAIKALQAEGVLDQLAEKYLTEPAP